MTRVVRRRRPPDAGRVPGMRAGRAAMTMTTASATTATAHAPASTAAAALPALAQAALLAGPFLSMVDSNIVNVALPDIARELGSPLTTVQWVVSAYLLALAVALAATAYLAKRFGTRRVYLASLVGFTAASALCAAAPATGALIAARALQGALGAPLVPLAMGMLLGRGGASRQLSPAAGMVLFLAPALGPSLGGLLLHLAGWSAVFLVNVPLGVVAGLGVRRLPRGLGAGADPAVRFDAPGFALLAAGLTTAIYGASTGARDGWTTAGAWPFWAGGPVLLAAYAGWAARRAQPAVNLRLLRHPQAALALALCTLTSVVLFAVLFLLPVFIQNLQGRSALVAGLALLPQGLGTGLGTVLGQRLAARRGVRATVVLGMATLTAGTAVLLAIGVDTPVWATAALLSVRGLALGLIIQPLLGALIGGLPPEEAADGNTLFNVVQRLGGSLAIPLLATFFEARERL